MLTERIFLVLAWAAVGALFSYGAFAAENMPSPLQQDDPVLEKLLNRMEAARQKLDTLSANIKHIRHIEALDLDEVWEGEMKFKMPRLLRIELSNAELKRQKLFILGEKHGWLYKPDFKQAERFPLKDIDTSKKSANPFEFGLARDVRSLRESFEIRRLVPEKVNSRPAEQLELVPKKEFQDQTPYSRIILWIDDELSLPLQVRQHKSDGEIVETFVLSDVKLNPKFGFLGFGDPFDFKPPKGVEVFDHEELGGL